MSNSLIQPKGSVSIETNIQSIARLTGSKIEEVKYLEDGLDISGLKFLYDSSTETVWKLNGDETGLIDEWFIQNEMMTIQTNINTYYIKQIYLGLFLETKIITDPDGYTKIGGFFNAEGLSLVGSSYGSVYDRIKQRGQYDILSGFADPKGIAGITFGGDSNKGTIIIDERGRIQTYAVKDNIITGSRLSLPYSELYGQGENGLNGNILRIPFAGAEDDSLHSSLIFIPTQSGSSDMYIAGPGQYTNFSSPYEDSKIVSPRVVTTQDIIEPMLQGMINPTDQNSSTMWVELFTVNTGISNSGPNFTGLYTVGGPLSESIYTYLIECNDVFVSSLTTATNKHVLRVTNLRDDSDYRYTTTNLPSFGYVYDNINGKLIVYAKLATRNEGATLIPIRISKKSSDGKDKVIINKNENSYSSTEPTGIVYVNTAKSLTSNTYVPTNSGEVVKTTGAVVRICNGISSSTKSPVRDGFIQNDQYSAINRGYAGLGLITVNKTATGTYTISGATTGTASNLWKIKNPLQTTNGGLQQLVATIISDTNNLITIEVRNIIYTVTGSTVSQTLGNLVDIPSSSWLDVHTTLL